MVVRHHDVPDDREHRAALRGTGAAAAGRTMTDIPGYDLVTIVRSAEGPIVTEGQEGYFWVARNAKGEMVEMRSMVPRIPEPKPVSR